MKVLTGEDGVFKVKHTHEFVLHTTAAQKNFADRVLQLALADVSVDFTLRTSSFTEVDFMNVKAGDVIYAIPASSLTKRASTAKETDSVAGWLRTALHSLRQAWANPPWDSRLQFNLIPEYRRNLKLVLDAIPEKKRNQGHQEQPLFSIVWGSWVGDVLESVNIKDEDGQPASFLNKIKIRRSNIAPERYEATFE